MNRTIRYPLISLVFLALVSWTQAPEPIKPLVYKVEFSGKFFTTDNLGNLFLVTRDNSIVKYDQTGAVKARVNFKIYGEISQLDVSNPFEIYAYYRDQQTVSILDNLLSLHSTISLNGVSTGEISSACRSFDNGLWYFDAGNMKLRKTDKSLNTKQEGLPFATWTNLVWNPKQMLDNEKYLFVNDSSQGIAVFDVFANYFKTIPITGINDFQVKKNEVYFYQDSLLQRYNFNYRRYDTLLYQPGCKNLRIDAGNLFRWQNDTMYVEPFINY